jgi:hypothetical protein
MASPLIAITMGIVAVACLATRVARHRVVSDRLIVMGSIAEAIIEKYGMNDDSVIALLADPDESPSVGSIHPRRERPTAETAIVAEDETSTHPSIEPATIASPIVTETQLRQNGEVTDDIVTTGPTVRRIPAAPAEPVEDTRNERPDQGFARC